MLNITPSGNDAHHKGLGLVWQSEKCGLKIWFDSTGILEVLCFLEREQNLKKNEAPELEFHHYFPPPPQSTSTRFCTGLASIPQLFQALVLPSSAIAPRSCSRWWKGEPWLQMEFLSSPEQCLKNTSSWSVLISSILENSTSSPCRYKYFCLICTYYSI